MALVDFHFSDGILITRGESNLTLQDATTWVKDLHACAAGSGRSIVVLLDLTKTSRIVSSSYIVLADVGRSPAVSALIFVTRSSIMHEAAQAIGAMSERGRVHIFEHMHDARLFAQVCAHNSRAAFA